MQICINVPCRRASTTFNSVDCIPFHPISRSGSRRTVPTRQRRWRTQSYAACFPLRYANLIVQFSSASPDAMSTIRLSVRPAGVSAPTDRDIKQRHPEGRQAAAYHAIPSCAVRPRLLDAWSVCPVHDDSGIRGVSCVSADQRPYSDVISGRTVTSHPWAGHVTASWFTYNCRDDVVPFRSAELDSTLEYTDVARVPSGRRDSAALAYYI